MWRLGHQSIQGKSRRTCIIFIGSVLDRLNQRLIRQFAAQMMKRYKLPGKRINESPINSAAVAKICQFHKSLADKEGPTVLDFELALDPQVLEDHQEECITWNDRAAEVFAEAFINQEIFPGKNRQRIVTRFKVHIRSLREHFSRQIRPISPEKKIKAAHEQRRRSVGFNSSNFNHHY